MKGREKRAGNDEQTNMQIFNANSFNVKVRATTLGSASLEQSEVSAGRISSKLLSIKLSQCHHNMLIILQIEANSLHTHTATSRTTMATSACSTPPQIPRYSGLMRISILQSYCNAAPLSVNASFTTKCGKPTLSPNTKHQTPNK